MTRQTDTAPPEPSKTMLGQLIAEISKFGGMDKTKASQLAALLLPHIDQYAEAHTRRKQAEARLSELQQLMQKVVPGARSMSVKKVTDRLAELQGGRDE